jgi:ankyrin repeat protein/mono/diheme cytochrome c family protein
VALVASSLGAADQIAPKAEDSADSGDTPLHLAAFRGDGNALDALLAQGADANALNRAGATPLHYGVTSERIVAALLSHGAKPDVASNIGVTPLLGAVAIPDSFPVVRRLVAAGANVNVRRQAAGGPLANANVLAVASVGGDMRTIALLLDRGAEVNPAQGAPPLTVAALHGRPELVRLYLDHGANLDANVGMAGSALNAALLSGHQDVAKLLIERGADLRLKSLRGYATPPMVWSAYNDAGDPTIARLLVPRGVDVDAANDIGETALSYALKNGPDTELVRYLRSVGAKNTGPAPHAKAIPSRAVPTEPAKRAAMVRDGAQRAIVLLQRSSTAFLENGFVRDRAQCVSCHQQALPAVAFGLARERGLRVDERELGRQLAATIADHTREAERARELDEPDPGGGTTLGYDFDGLNALHYAPDELTGVTTRYLLHTQQADGWWSPTIRRPPIEDGVIVRTAWSARALQLYPPAGRGREIDDALRRTRTWLARQPTPTHNDRVFQLLGLAWSNETPPAMREFADALARTQRSDGGWAQLPGLGSDAWATGSALFALYKAGVTTSHPAYQRGVEFLLHTQFDDGSWFVRSRTWPFQPHFDGKFPHGKDQWISAAGTAWATIALLVTLEPTVPADRLPNGQALIAAFQAAEASVSAPGKTDAPGEAATAMSFARDIKPLFERSCAACHIGEKVRGNFSLASRQSLLAGGQSGDPAIVPGRSGDSPLLRYVSDQVEDLEMPPLSRRDKYPRLTADEIARVSAWIDAGAEWDN